MYPEVTPLGAVGATGAATGPHVHVVEWIDGVRVWPEHWSLAPTPIDPRTVQHWVDVAKGWGGLTGQPRSLRKLEWRLARYGHPTEADWVAEAAKQIGDLGMSIEAEFLGRSS